MPKNLGSIGETNVQVVADSKRLRQGLRSAEAQTRRSSEAMSASIGQFGAALKGLGIAAVVAGLVKLGRDAVKAFQIQEQAVRSLTTAMQLQGATIGDVNQALEHASELQGRTVFGDEATIDAMRRAIATGADYTEVIQNASLAQDIASATGRDLGMIFEVLGRAIQGDITMLQRYVPSIKQLSAEEKGWLNIRELLNKQFAGTAAENAKSYTGKLQQMSNAWGDLKEQAGKAILVIASPVVREMLDIFTGLNELLSGSARKLRQFSSAEEELLHVEREMLTVLQSQMIIAAKEEAYNRLAKRKQELESLIIAQELAVKANEKLAESFGIVVEPWKLAVGEGQFEIIAQDLVDVGSAGGEAFDIIRQGQDKVVDGFKDVQFAVTMMGDIMGTAVEIAARRMEWVFSRHFFDVMMGNTRDLGKAMGEMFAQLMADALALIARLAIVAAFKALFLGAPFDPRAIMFNFGKQFAGGIPQTSAPSLGGTVSTPVVPESTLGMSGTGSTFILEVDGEVFYNSIKSREAFERRSGIAIA